jgi:hypothetical protein
MSDLNPPQRDDHVRAAALRLVLLRDQGLAVPEELLDRVESAGARCRVRHAEQDLVRPLAHVLLDPVEGRVTDEHEAARAVSRNQVDQPQDERVEHVIVNGL